MYNVLKSRIKRLETNFTGEDFTIPIFPPFELANVHHTMDSWGIDHNRIGQICLITDSDGVKGTLEYNPKKLDLVKEQLDIVTKEYLTNPQKHESNKHIYLQ